MTGNGAAAPIIGGPAAARGETNRHYDQDPRVFELFLGSHLKYSAGLYRDGASTLDDAQTAKLHFIARRLGLSGGERILDVGCGWGSVACFLASEYGCQVTGITPAPRQADYVRARAQQAGIGDRVRTVVTHFQDFTERAEFDGVCFVGSIVHIPRKREVLAQAARLLRNGGRLYLSETCFRNERIASRFISSQGVDFLREQIFGWGELVPLSAYVGACEDAGLSLCAVDDLSADYARTVAQWRLNVQANADGLESLQPGSVAQLLRYFDICNAAWGYTTKQYALTAGRVR